MTVGELLLLLVVFFVAYCLVNVVVLMIGRLVSGRSDTPLLAPVVEAVDFVLSYFLMVVMLLAAMVFIIVFVLTLVWSKLHPTASA